MAINNDRNLLEQQILSNSGLKGKELENLRARLATLSEQQLQAELSKSLSGNNKGEWYTGVMLEHNESVIMRNNHEQITYTDDSGNEISELKDGDEVLERTIKSTDDKGNVFETTVTFLGGRPLTQTNTKNGNTTETTTYKYNDDADVPFVTVETKKADQSKVMTNVLEIDENGNFDNEDFIDRQTTSMDGTTTHIFTENNCVIEQQVKQNGKKIDTIYKGDSIEDYDNKKLHRVYQRTELKGEVHEVAYDGNGNTRTVVQNGESPSAIAKQFGVKESSLRRLNPARGKNAITQVGADIVVPGEYNADARVMTRRKSKQGAMQDFANDEVQRTTERLYSSTMQEVTLDKDYKDAYSYARALLAADGVKNPSNQQVNNKANEILVANGNIKFKKGTKVQIAEKAPDSKFVQDLSNNGFKPTRENAIFYNRFNALNPSQQQNVLSVIKYCKSQKITDPNKIKARILETFPEINLFDSGKVIPMNSSFGTPAFQRKNPVALETFLTETLKLDLKSDVGRQVYERLASLPQEELGKINGSNFGDLSKSDFNDIANRFESSGVNIRTQFENQIEQNSRAHRAERLGIPQQKFTSEMLANIYDRAADMMEEYYHNHGVFDAGTYLEGLKNITDWITPDNLFGIDMRSTLHVASDCRKAAQRFRQMHTDNPETFKREYAQLKKDGLVTADYNQQNVQEFMNLIQSGDVDINSDKFKNACKKAFGFKGIENTEKYIQTGQMAGNIGDIAVMLYTLGAASELKMMGKATQGVYGALERGAGRIMSKTAAQKTAKICTSMAMGGTTLGGFTLGKETLNNLSNPMRDATSWETWKETGIASAESFGFGAFGGLLNETVVAPIVKAIEKPATKATQAVSKALTEQGELTGKQIMQTVSESGGLKLDGLFKMNSQELANLVRTATAKGVGFGAEVTGFTAYEAGLDIIKDLIDPKTGRLPDNIDVKYLCDKFGEQLSNLGTIKGVSMFLMMRKGGKIAQKAMLNEFLSESEALKNIKFKKAEINGHEVYEVTYPNGNRAVVSSPEQAIATCQMAMQMEFIAKSLTEGEPKSEITRPQGMNAQEDALIQKARKENPATVVEEKVRRQWQQHDIETPIPDEKVDLFNLDPDAGLKEPVQNVENEVTSLIFKGKLNETLTQRYDEMGRVFTEIAKKHSADIEALAKANPKDKQAVADGIVKILAQELGMEGFEPPIVFADTSVKLEDGTTAKTDGGADWPNGRIVINEDITNVKKLTSIISHEFVHMLQYRDVLAQYGEQGLRELIANDKSIPEDKKESYIKDALENDYNKHLLQSYNFQRAQEGTVEDYLRRIYKDEFTNTVGTENMPRYVDQASERGAYSSQEKVDRGLDESNLDELSIGEIGLSNAELLQQRLAKMREKIGGKKSGQDISSNDPLNAAAESAETVEIDEFGQVHRKPVPAGISTMSDAEFAAKGRELCRRPDGTESPAARALLEAIKNSELTKSSYDPNTFNLEKFKEMSRDYQGNMFDEATLKLAKEMVECIPKGKDDNLLTSTELTINKIIVFQFNYAKPEAKKQIIDATKKLLSNPYVRNGVVDDIIDACTEGNSKDGYTFNQKAFDAIENFFVKKEVDGYEQYPIKNREFTQDFTYSLMVAEIAKNAIRYKTNTDGKQIKYFDDINFKIGMLQPAADPYRRYVHYDIAKDRETGEINLHDRSDILQNYIIKTVEDEVFDLNKTSILKEDAKKLRELCMVDGKLDVQNCFAVYYMENNLGLYSSDIINYLENYKNQNGILDTSMLRLIKDYESSRFSDIYYDNHLLGSPEYRKSVDTTKSSKAILYGKNGLIYDKNGHVDKNIVDLLPNCSSMIASLGTENFVTDGRYDIEKIKSEKEKVDNFQKRIEDIGVIFGGNQPEYATEAKGSAILNLYKISKDKPEILDEAVSLLSQIENFDLDSNYYQNGRGFALMQAKNIEELRYFAQMSPDIYKVLSKHEQLKSYLDGKPIDDFFKTYMLNNLTPEEKTVLENNGFYFDYISESENNRLNRKSVISEQAQIQFEQTIETLDKTLATADVSRGIELEYSREQFEKDIIDVIRGLPESQANTILNLYGLSYNNDKIEGVICKPKSNIPKDYSQVVQKIEQYINKFQHNQVITQDPTLNSLYTALTVDFPEFSMLVGKVGKDGQRVDTTILKQIQALINNPQYKILSPKEQQMAKLALMFRGFSEINSTPDVIEKTFMIDNDGLGFNVTHKRYKNSEYTAAILERFNLTESEKYALGDLVAHSGWSKEFNGGIVDRGIAVDVSEDTKYDPSLQPENNAAKVAVNNRFGTLKLSKLIEDVINPANNVDISKIEQMQKQVYQHMQIVSSATAKDLEPYWETQIIDGVECQVIDLRKTKLPDNFYLMGHFTQHGVNKLYNLLSNNNDKVFLSNSLIRPGSAQTFAGRTEGIISEFDNRNVAETCRMNIDSGFGKSYIDFVNTMAGKGSREVASNVKEKLNLTDEEYGLLMEQIVDKRLNELDEYYNIGGRYLSKQEIINAHNEAYESMLSSQGEQNEITILNQKPIAYAYSASRTYQGLCPFGMKDNPLKRVIIFP